ncbi:MAG: YfcE family phosphodiesterase [Syntrophomonadaceae bacterium]|jgi:putative phosphoesterase
MKIAVTGDTHGRIEEVRNSIMLHKVEGLFFTGDFYADGVRLAKELKVDYYGVSGNCDVFRKGKEEQIIELDDIRFYLIHGHQYSVKHGGLQSLYYRCQELKAQAVIYGHTHVANCEQIDDIWFINPGSPTNPRNKIKTWVLLDLYKDRIVPAIQNL